VHSPGPSPQSQRTRQPSCRSRASASSNNLVDALSAQFVPVGNLRHRLSMSSSRQYLPVPLQLPVGTGPKRTPSPPRHHLKAADAFRRQLVLPVAATGVVDPVPKSNWVTLVPLDVSCRDFTMALAHTELIERTDVLDEGIFVVHGKQSSHDRAKSNAARGKPRDMPRNLPIGRVDCMRRLKRYDLFLTSYGGGKHA